MARARPGQTWDPGVLPGSPMWVAGTFSSAFPGHYKRTGPEVKQAGNEPACSFGRPALQAAAFPAEP